MERRGRRRARLAIGTNDCGGMGAYLAAVRAHVGPGYQRLLSNLNIRLGRKVAHHGDAHLRRALSGRAHTLSLSPLSCCFPTRKNQPLPQTPTR